MEWYKKNNVKLVPKTENPPNCPELRVIEKYWAIIKRKMKKTKKLCRNINNIKISFKKASNSFYSYSVHKLMGTTKAKARNFITGCVKSSRTQYLRGKNTWNYHTVLKV